VLGGSIAVGHPFGMAGSRLTGLLVRVPGRRKGTLGLVSMRIGKGIGAKRGAARLDSGREGELEVASGDLSEPIAKR